MKFVVALCLFCWTFFITSVLAGSVVTNEIPTLQELTNSAKPNDDQERQVARVAITKKAQAWSERIGNAYEAGRTSWANTIPANTIVAIKYYHPKYSKDAGAWQTSEWNNLTWLKVTPPRVGSVSPDDYWSNIAGTSYESGKVSIAKGFGASTPKITSHETGHATQYHFFREFFGVGDHSPTNSISLMHPNGLGSSFSLIEQGKLKGEKTP